MNPIVASVVSDHPAISTIVIVLVVAGVLFFLPGCAVNGVPMREAPGASLSRSWFISGQTSNGAPVSCSFVEFDERGDYLDFSQHKDCQKQIRDLVSRGKVLLLIYCHGWKNNSQSGDVVRFNAFLAKLAASDEIREQGLRVHGVYLSWKGNNFLPYIDTGDDNEFYRQTVETFGGPIVDEKFHRNYFLTGVVPETLSYWNRKGAAENHVSGLPIARSIFTYAATAKDYGRADGNRVCVMGHSFGALMLEQSLGQAMSGALTMEWWEGPGDGVHLQGLPFDLILFVNSAAPSIYAKEMRDFLEAHRRALGINHDPNQDVPVIVSLTSTADWATGVVHPIGNFLAPFDPTLQRQYTSGIFGRRQKDGSFPEHPGIRQSDFYIRTPGHQPYLINHWIVKEADSKLPPDTGASAIFSANLRANVGDPDLFFTSKAKYPAAAWRLTREPQGPPEKLGGLSPAMPDSDYWIISCGKELIGGHTDVWSATTMEMYAALFRAVESRRRSLNRP